MKPGISVLIASGRSGDMLANIVAQVGAQMEPGDQLIVDVNDDAPWGHKARNRMMGAVRSGNGMVFYDDDDLLEPGGLHIIRAAFRNAPDCWHIFKMRYGATTLWRQPVLQLGNVSTQMICVPQSMGIMCRWGDRYEGDYDFMANLAYTFGSPIWHDEIVAIHNGQRG